jgi:hypothetical protein
MYVVVEYDPDLNQHHVLFPRHSLIQVHATVESAEEHLKWYVGDIFQEDPDAGAARVSIYRLEPV